MRGGTYGWQAARKGFAFIAWTNTIANMPAWGGTEPKLGNNPIVLAVPFQDKAIVLDMAMSQYSFGALELQEMQKQKLPVPGGFDTNGELTTDPSEILVSRRVLPIGYWKGAGFSFLLDIFATILSGGMAVHQISKQPAEVNLSQIFIAVDLSRLHNYSAIGNAIEQIINDYKKNSGEEKSLYPGERVLTKRNENSKTGIPVHRKVWEEIKALS
jgi:3-dehydro-L-gulonate 2-dehydrogenase